LIRNEAINGSGFAGNACFETELVTKAMVCVKRVVGGAGHGGARLSPLWLRAAFDGKSFNVWARQRERRFRACNLR
jgi:hypothetical protein